MVDSSAASIRSVRRKPYLSLSKSLSMLSYLGPVRNSVGPREKDLPSTPVKQQVPSYEGETKPLSPSQQRLEDLGPTLPGYPQS